MLGSLDRMIQVALLAGAIAFPVSAHAGDAPGAIVDAMGGNATDPWRPAVRAMIYLDDPYAGGTPIVVRLLAADFLFDRAGRPLAGPTGPRVRIAGPADTSAWNGATGSTVGGSTGSTVGGSTGSTVGGSTGSTVGGSTGSTVGGSTGASTGEVPFPLAEPDARGRFILRPGDRRLASITAFAAANRTLRVAERYAGRKLRLGESDALTVRVSAAQSEPYELNAFFDPGSEEVHLWFAQSYFTSPEAVVYDTALSSDVVAHEVGHAVYNALKPYTLHWASPSSEHTAVHEAFADICAMLDAFRQATVRNAALSESAADLRRPNRIANLAEGLAMAMDGLPPGRAGASAVPVIRSALNREVYTPGTVASMGPHAASLPLSGAVYELIARLYDLERARGNKAGGAALRASETVGILVFAGLSHCSDDAASTLPEIAEGILAADLIRNRGRLASEIIAAFGPRNLLDEGSVARISARLRSLPELRAPERLATLDDADALLARCRGALGWPEERKLRAASVTRDRAGYTRVVYRQSVRDTRSANLAADADLWLGEMDRAAYLSIGSAYLVFGAEGRLVDAAAELRDPGTTWPEVPGEDPAAPPDLRAFLPGPREDL